MLPLTPAAKAVSYAVVARDFTLAVVAPDRSVMDEPVTSLVAPGFEGYIGVMAGHTPLIAALRPGVVEYTQNNQRYHIYVGGGFLEVRPDRVTVLADEASRATDIDLADAEAKLEECRRALRGEGSMSTEKAVEEMERAIQRIRASRVARNN